MHRPATASLMVAGAMVLGFTSAFAQSAASIVGTWTASAHVNITADGSRSDIFGADPNGRLMFQPDGQFMLLYTRSNLPRFVAGSRMQGTPEENKAIVQGSVGIFGTYTVDGKILKLKVAGGTWPSWTGTEQTAQIDNLTGDELVYSIPNTVGGRSVNTLKRPK